MKKPTMIILTIATIIICQAQVAAVYSQKIAVANVNTIIINKKVIIENNNTVIDSLQAIADNYTGSILSLTDTAKTIKYDNWQLGYIGNNFELFFDDEDYVYRLFNNDTNIFIEKRYRNDSLSIKLHVPLND